MQIVAEKLVSGTFSISSAICTKVIPHQAVGSSWLVNYFAARNLTPALTRLGLFFFKESLS